MLKLESKDIKRKFSRWLFAAILDWVIMAAALILARFINHPVSYILGGIVVASRQHALGLLGHDGAHGLACKNRQLNDFLTGILCFWPAGISTSQWRKFHMDHHRHMGTQLDPELMGKSAVPDRWKMPRSKLAIAKMILRDLVGLGVVDIISMRKNTPKSASAKMDRIGLPLWHVTLIALSLYTGNYWIIGMFYLSFMTATVCFIRLRLWSEHMGDQTRTNRFSAKWWQRFLFLPHNTDCHYEHHASASVPFFNLRKIRARNNTERILTLEELFGTFIKAGQLEEIKEHGSKL